MTLVAERPPRSDAQAPKEAELSSEMRFAALPTALLCAELFTKFTLDAWQLNELVDLAEQAVGTLVDHSVHTAGLSDPDPRAIYHHDLNAVTVRLTLVDDRLVIEVADDIAEFPQDEQAEINSALTPGCGRWSHYRPDRGGKVVWCEMGPRTKAAGSRDQTQELPVVLPRRIPRTFTSLIPPIEIMNDFQVLNRIRDGLLDIDAGTRVM